MDTHLHGAYILTLLELQHITYQMNINGFELSFLKGEYYEFRVAQ